jgi:branched-chain amino acid transport system permease protein
MAYRLAAPSDQQVIAYVRFTDRLKAELRTLCTAELIEEHRRKPLGQHSDALERVLNFFRRPPSYGLYSTKPYREYRLIRLPVKPGATPTPLDGTVYTDKNEAMHAVFLCHVRDLMAE